MGVTVPVEVWVGGGDTAGAGLLAEMLEGLASAADALVRTSVDECTEVELIAGMPRLQRELDRLSGVQARWASARRTRAAGRAAGARPDDPRASEKARQQVQQDIAAELGVTRAEAGRLAEAGRQMDASPGSRRRRGTARCGPSTPR